MKKMIILSFITLSLLSAYSLTMGGPESNTIFDADARESLLVYPKNWLRPSQELFSQVYDDSSYTYAKWDQYYYLDRNAANNVIAKYTPFSFPHRWSVGLQFRNTNTNNPYSKVDAVLNYKHKAGEVQYYHTNNNQTLVSTEGNTVHSISAHALSFKHSIFDDLNVSGAIDINSITQVDDTTRVYDIHHEQLALKYNGIDNILIYGKYHHWYWIDHERQGPADLFFPGVRYISGNYYAEASLRISPSSVKPIFVLNYNSDQFYLQAFTKVRSSRLTQRQSADQYLGVKAGIKHQFKNIDLDLNYSNTVNCQTAAEIINNVNRHSQFKGQVDLKLNKTKLYLGTEYNHIQNAKDGFYHPERAVVTPGIRFISTLFEGNLVLNGDLNAQYIIHEDPENVSFNPSTLSYTLTDESELVSDWLINLKLDAVIQSFTISAMVSLPPYLKSFSKSAADRFAVFSTAGNMLYGHAAYAGLRLQWYWWK